MTQKPKKHLGQHFLHSKNARGMILDVTKPEAGDIILEIGPGRGFLTEGLLESSPKVIAVEKDEELVSYLEKRFEEEIKNNNLEVVCGDILDFNPSEHSLDSTEYKLVGNIPYYITGAVLRKFLSIKQQPERIVLVVQKEVAERIVSRDGKESVLSISVSAYGKPKYIKTIKSSAFSPSPKVDSAILTISEISHDLFKDIDESAFFELVKKGFSHKRKILNNNIEIPDEVFSSCNINPSSRAEELSLSEWKCVLLNQ